MHKLPKLKYEYNALEPYIDAKTLKIHHTKHHQSYVDKLNTALENYPDLAEHQLDELLQSLDTVPEDIRRTVRNAGGGHYNHSLFWQVMRPNKSEEPKGELAETIEKDFGDFASFRKDFSDTAVGVFGSGWAWLAVDVDKSLKIISTSNHDSPLLDGLKPIMCIDVWEHAYYLKYQNRRADFIEAWWNVVNWEYVEQLYKENKD